MKNQPDSAIDVDDRVEPEPASEVGERVNAEAEPKAVDEPKG